MEEADDGDETDSHLHDLINYADKFVAAYAEHQRLEAGRNKAWRKTHWVRGTSDQLKKEKPSKEVGTMIYAVYRGRKPGLYTSWNDCSLQVTGFKGSIFKSFKTRDAAEEWMKMNGNRSSLSSSSSSLSSSGATGGATSSLPSSSSVSRGDEDLTFKIYTDGSCKGNNNVRDNVCPAGWGVVVVQNSVILEELYGPVELDKSSRFYLRADVGSNNTAELSAIGEALLWVKDFGLRHYLRSSYRKHGPRPGPRIKLCYDSEYAACCVMGRFNGNKNYELYQYCRDLKREVERMGWKIEWEKVKAHSGDTHNERADTIAVVGCHMRCKTGRFSEDAIPVEGAGKARRRDSGVCDDDDEEVVVVATKKQRKIVDLT